MILCMGRINGTKGERQGDYQFLRVTDDGQWGIWKIPDEATSRIKQLVNDRTQIEASQEQYSPTKQERHEAYQAILSQLPLAPADRADLEARGLTPEQIEAIGFKSVEQWQTLRDEVNWRVPGVHPSGRSLVVGGAGYLCPVRNMDGLIVAMQVRLRQPGINPETGKQMGRYRWLSSRTTVRPNPPDARISGEWPLPIVQPEGCDTKNIWIVEGTGTKPAITAYRFGAVVIGAAGGQWADSPQHLRYVLNRLKPNAIILAPDAGCIQVDPNGQQSVMRRMANLHALLKRWGYNLQVAWWGQDVKPQAQSDKRVVGDIDEIGRDVISRIQIISFDDLRRMAAEALQAKNLDGQVGDIGRSIPEPDDRPIPEPESEEDEPEEVKLEKAIQHLIQVEAQGNPIRTGLRSNGICKVFGISRGDLRDYVAFVRSKTQQSQGLVHVSDIYANLYSEMEDRSEGNSSPGIPSGFRDLDTLTQGWQRSDFIIAAGRPSMGKTGFLANVARHAAVTYGLPVAIFSLEMSRLQLAYRLLSSETTIETGRLRTGRLRGGDPNNPQDSGEWGVVSNAIATLATAPLYIDDTPSIRLSELRNKAMRLQAEVGSIGLILVDYLQLIDGNGDNRNVELSKISQELKALARELNVPVIALSQLSRGVESRSNKRPMMSDLRDSGAIEQDADLIMMLYREEYYDPETPDRGIAEIIITKHRNGPTGTVKLLFEPQYTRFRNIVNTDIG
jgi:replicative DNA helicase